MRALLALGRFDETRTLGLRYFEEATNERPLIMSHHAAISLAMAEAELGQGEKAVERIDAAVGRVSHQLRSLFHDPRITRAPARTRQDMLAGDPTLPEH